MKVVQVTPYFMPHIGGVESHVLELSKMLKKRGHEVTVLTALLKGTKPEEEVEGINVLREKPMLTAYTTPVTSSFKRTVARLDADVVHAHTPPPVSAYYASKGCGRAGIPFVLTYHCDPILSGVVGRMLLALYKRTIGPSTLKRTDELILTTESYDATSRVTWNYESKIIPNAVDIDTYNPKVSGADVRKRMGMLDGQSLVLFVGRLVPHKGVQYLVRAAGLIKTDEIRVVVCGDGPLLGGLKDEVKRLGLEKKVTFVGKVPYKELPGYFSACDIFCLPSTSRLEAFGIAALEAMATARPVVVSDIPGVREVIQDGKQGFIAKACSPEDIAEKITLLHEDPAARKRMGDLARRTVEEKYSWDRIVERVEEVYKEAISENK
jgi:glycosyltransferase involved in cell wall biosynthesis